MERVLAVRVDADGRPTVVTETGGWLPAIDDGAPTRDAWETHFAAWGPQAVERAGEAAQAALGMFADEFAREHAKILNAERRRIDDWLKGRAEEICGKPQDEGPTLFDRVEPVAPRTPEERLQEFVAGQSAGAKLRSEAETVLGYYRREVARLVERAELRAPDLAPLGLLMLIPKPSTSGDGHGR